MLIFGVMFYEIYLLSFNQHKEKVLITPKKKFFPTTNTNEKKGKNEIVHPQNNKQVSTYLSKALSSTKTKASQLKTDIVSPDEIAIDLFSYSYFSPKDEFESSTFVPFDGYNHLINEDEIDFIFPSNDKDLYNILHSKEFLTNWDTSFLGDDYWNFIGRLDEESKKDVTALREKYESFNKANSRKLNSDLLSSKSSKYFDFNGLSSDLALLYKGTGSVGKDGLYWYTSNDCIQHKACNIYPIHRILQKSKQISCNEILNEILPNIYKCIAEKGKKCENVIDSGYYRVIMKTVYAKTGEEIVIKMMKTKSIKKDRDLMRHVREAILLGTLFDEEQEFMADAANKDALFTQTLFGRERQRAFNYVEEYGHCVLPLWISVSPLYRMALDKWIQSGLAGKSKLSKLVFMSLQIAKSVEIIHTIRGGPYHHTDIQPRQFLLDDFDNVYINDFNRGKFQPFYFDESDGGKVTKCWYCGHRSRGHWRAPEEPRKRPLNEKLDIFSMGLTIWSLYSNDVPFKEASFDELPFLYYDLRRIPEMTPNIPPAIKDIIRSCLKWDPRQRPTATEVVEMFEDVYFDKLKMVTEGFEDYTSNELMEAKTWKETNYPPLEKRKKPDESSA